MFVNKTKLLALTLLILLAVFYFANIRKLSQSCSICLNSLSKTLSAGLIPIH